MGALLEYYMNKYLKENETDIERIKAETEKLEAETEQLKAETEKLEAEHEELRARLAKYEIV